MMTETDRLAYELKLSELKHEVSELKDSVTQLTGSVEGLVEAWNTAKGITAFVKWISSLAVAGGVLYGVFFNRTGGH